METMIIEGDFINEKALEWKKVLNKSVSRTQFLHIDVSNTKAADLVAVNAIATTYKLLQDNNGRMTLKINKDSSIYNLLNLTKFLELIPKSISTI